MTELKPEQIYPKVGITMMVFKGDKVLLGKRKGSHGAGEWAFPGGSMEYMETIAQTVKREIAEEVGIEASEPEFVRLCNLRDYPPKHFIDIAVKMNWISGEPKVLEPEKAECWEWFSQDELPEPMFKGTKTAIEAYKQGVIYIDA
jgi:8-oxo-dGTP diphosphatase